MATLKFVNEAGEDEILDFGPDRPEILVGRNKECDLRTRNNTVSRLHAKFCWAGGRYSVIDLDSANGTYYRKRRVKEEELEDGESVFVGSLPVEFRLDDKDRAYLGSTEMEPPPLPLAARPTVTGAAALDVRHPTLGYDSTALPIPAQASSQGPGGETVAWGEEALVGAERSVEPDAGEVVSFSRGEAAEAGARPREAAAGGRDGDANARRLLDEQRQRQGREEELLGRVAILESDVADRDARIRQLGAQVEDLSRMVARYQAESATSGEANSRIADLERVLNAAEVEKTSLEEALEGARVEIGKAAREADAADARAREASLTLEGAQRERDTALARVVELEGQIAGLLLQVEDLGREVMPAEARAALEASAVEAEARRVEAVARQAEAEARALEAGEMRAEAESRLAEMERIAAAAVLQASATTPLAAIGAQEAADALAASAALEAATREAAEAREALGRLTAERDALLDETQRWDALKHRFESDRSEMQGEVEALRKQVSDLTVVVSDTRSAAGKANDLAAQAQALADELAELKVANRSYLKKMSRLLEENESLKAGASADAAPDQALAEVRAEGERRRIEAEGARAEVEGLRKDLAESRGRAERLAERVAALEAVPAPAAAAPAGAAAAGVPAELKELVERINDSISEFRTGLDVLGGLVPELLDRLPAVEGDDSREQIGTALTDLRRLAKELKSEAVKARKRL